MGWGHYWNVTGIGAIRRRNSGLRWLDCSSANNIHRERRFFLSMPALPTAWNLILESVFWIDLDDRLARIMTLETQTGNPFSIWSNAAANADTTTWRRGISLRNRLAGGWNVVDSRWREAEGWALYWWGRRWSVDYGGYELIITGHSYKKRLPNLHNISNLYFILIGCDYIAYLYANIFPRKITWSDLSQYLTKMIARRYFKFILDRKECYIARNLEVFQLFQQKKRQVNPASKKAGSIQNLFVFQLIMHL